MSEITPEQKQRQENVQETQDSTIDLLTSILSHIEERFGEEELSVSQCLRKLFSTKQRPSRFIKHLLQLLSEESQQQQQQHGDGGSSTTANALRETHFTILEHLSRISDISCMLAVKVVSTTIFFLQLVLESMTNNAEHQQGEHQQEYLQMSVALIQALQQAVVGALVVHNKENGESNKINTIGNQVLDVVPRQEEKHHGPTLAAFVVGALLRTINPYVASSPVLLSPLWKSLCDLLSKMPLAPPDLLRASLTSLMVYVKEGERPCLKSACAALQQQQQQQHDPQQHLFHAKVLGFLLARLTTLLPLHVKSSVDDDENEQDSGKLVSGIFLLLVRVRGVSMAVFDASTSSNSLSQPLIQSYKSLAKKVDQCIIKSIRKDSSSEVLYRPMLTMLLAIKTTASSAASFEAGCLRLGKLSILQTILQQTSLTAVDRDDTTKKSSSNAELILLVAEQAIFSTLPQQQLGQKDATSSWEVIVTATVRATIALEATPGKSRSWVRQMLVKWLSRRLHPTSREAVVSLVCNHIVGLSKLSSAATSPRSSVVDVGVSASVPSSPFMELLAQILFDLRTMTCHRENIASVWHRLLATSSGSGSSNIRTLAQQVLSTQIGSFLNKLRSSSSNNKRKRSAEKSKHSFASLALSDWTILLDLASSLDYSTHEFLRKEVTLVMSTLSNRNDNHVTKQSGIFHLGKHSPLELALILSGTQHQHQKPSRALQVMGWFLSQTQRRRKGAVLTRNGAILNAAVLRFLGRSFGNSTGSEIPIGPMAKVLCWSVEQAKQLLSSIHNEECGVVLALSVGSVLRKSSKAVSPTTPAAVVQQLASCFHDLFKMGLWTVLANTMSCMIDFASSLSKTHQGILMKCLPDAEMQGLFRSRLQGLVFRPTNANGVKSANLEQAQISCLQRLNRLIPNVPVKESPFATSTTNVLAPGSFLLNMPTMEDSGRSALVIFPPGDQSLEDIKHMLQKDSIDGQDVRVLQQVRVVDDDQNGSGCRLYSIKYSSGGN